MHTISMPIMAPAVCRAARFNVEVKDVSRRPDLRQEARKQRALSRRRQPEFATGIDLFSEVRRCPVPKRVYGLSKMLLPNCLTLDLRLYVALLPARCPPGCMILECRPFNEVS